MKEYELQDLEEESLSDLSQVFTTADQASTLPEFVAIKKT